LGQNPVSIDGIGGCNPPAAPTGLTATATAANQISLAWTAVGGISTYRVLRSIGTCPGSGYVQIAEVTGATSYVDNAVSGGSSYVYQVVAFDSVEECPSAPSACSSATASGTCALPPSFAGLTSATSAGTASCGIALSWPTAVGNCGAASNVRYNVYRGSSPDFTPAPANLLESCISATALADIEVESGVAQHYIVRAEDLGATPAAGQCNGVEETNLIRRSAAAFGPDTVAFSDDVESGPGAWAVAGTGAGANFAIVSTAANSPTRSWFVPNPTTASDRQLTLANPLSLAVGSNATLEFAHRYQTEASWDGGVLEYSLDGGTTWTDILGAQGGVPANASRFLAGGYVGPLSVGGATNPLNGRAAWHGSIAGFVVSRVNLADFGGRSVLLRFRAGSDSSVGGNGWWIDDLRVFEGTTCEAANLNFIFAHGFEGN
jgi:hypothetical protein